MFFIMGGMVIYCGGLSWGLGKMGNVPNGLVIVRKLSKDNGSARARLLRGGLTTLSISAGEVGLPSCSSPSDALIEVCLNNRFKGSPSYIGICTTSSFCTISHCTDCDHR